MFSDNELQEFIDLYYRKYGIKLERQDAFDMYMKLVNIIKIANNPDKEDKNIDFLMSYVII